MHIHFSYHNTRRFIQKNNLPYLLCPIIQINSLATHKYPRQQVYLMKRLGRLPSGEPTVAGVRGGPARRGGQHQQGFRLQAPVQEPCLLLQGRESVHF